MKDKGLDKGLVRDFESSSKTKGNIFGFRKMFWDYLKKINVPFYDACCADASVADSVPVRFNSDTEVVERFNASTGEWNVVPTVTSTLDSRSGPIEVLAGLETNYGISNASGLAQYVGFISISSQTNVTAGTGGAIPLTSYMTTINTDAGGDAFTLANGTAIGQLKKIYLLVDGGGDAVITPTSLSGGTTITMNDAGDYVVLMWTGSTWNVIENLGCAIA